MVGLGYYHSWVWLLFIGFVSYALGLATIHRLGRATIHRLGFATIQRMGLATIHRLGLATRNRLGLSSNVVLIWLVYSTGAALFINESGYFS